MNLGPQKISDTYQFVLNASGGSVTLGNGNNPNLIGTIIASTTGTQTISGVKTFQNNTIFNGNVGIGTTVPDEKLHIHNGDVKISRLSSEDSQYLNITTNSSNGGEFVSYSAIDNGKGLTIQSTTDTSHTIATAGSPSIGFKTYDTERMRITSGGYIGIGTMSPSSLLHVNGGIRARGGVPGANGVNNNGYTFSSPGDTDAGMFSSADNQVEFYTNNIERMRISGANVGIGTNNNTYISYGKTVVGGVTDSHISLLTPGSAQGEVSNLSFYSTFQSTTDNGPRRTADIIAGFSGGAWNNEYLSFNVGNTGNNNDSRIRTNEKMRIKSNGYIGIGTNSPTSKLHISGGDIQTDNIILGTQANKATISYGQNTARTFTLPSVTGNSTFAFIDQAQTFSSAQTLSSNLRVQGNLDFGASTLGGSAASSFLKTNAGQLGTTAGNALNLASIGFHSTNSTSLSFIARRQSDGSDWTTSAIGLSYNVGNTTPVNNQQIWMLADGKVGIGTNAPTEKLHINGNLRVQGSITCTNGIDLSSQESFLSADVSLPTSNTWVNGPSISLSAGTWLVQGHITFVRAGAATTTWFARITDGTTHHASTQTYSESLANVSRSVALTSVITLATTTTIRLQATTNNGAAGAVMKAALTSNGAGNNATQITAIRVG
jgi:hypothetical protein